MGTGGEVWLSRERRCIERSSREHRPVEIVRSLHLKSNGHRGSQCLLSALASVLPFSWPPGHTRRHTTSLRRPGNSPDCDLPPSCLKLDSISRCLPRKAHCSHYSTNSNLLIILSRGLVMCVGGPALIYYVTPTEEELFKARHAPPVPQKLTLMLCSDTTQSYKGDLWRTDRESSKISTIL